MNNREPYQPPTITDLGTVAELTLGTHNLHVSDIGQLGILGSG